MAANLVHSSVSDVPANPEVTLDDADDLTAPVNVLNLAGMAAVACAGLLAKGDILHVELRFQLSS